MSLVTLGIAIVNQNEDLAIVESRGDQQEVRLARPHFWIHETRVKIPGLRVYGLRAIETNGVNNSDLEDWDGPAEFMPRYVTDAMMTHAESEGHWTRGRNFKSDVVIAYGFPLVWVWSHEQWTPSLVHPGPPSNPAQGLRLGPNHPIAKSLNRSNGLLLPSRIRPAALLMNILVYGMVMATIYAILRRDLAAKRIQHGRCPECRQTLPDVPSLGCSECGWRRGNAI